MSPKNDMLETKWGQIYQNFMSFKPVWVTFHQLFQIKKWEGDLLERGDYQNKYGKVNTKKFDAAKV